MTSNRRMEFFIGMMVIGIIAGVFVMTILFGSEKGFFVGKTGGKRLTILFEKGSGISQNSLVLKNGIKIGRVYSVELDDNPENSAVKVSFELEPNYKIYSNEYAKINRTILGDASIEFVDDPAYPGEVYEIVDSDELIRGRNTGDIMGTVSNIEGDLAQALQNINSASQGVTQFMENINTILGDQTELQVKKERLQSVFTELEGALTSIKTLASNMDAVVSDPEIVDNIRKATAQAPEILNRVTELTDGAKQFMADANEMGADVRGTLKRAERTFDLVDKNLDNVNVFTTSLAENGPQMMTALNDSSVEIKSTINNISLAVSNISDLAKNLNEKLEDPNSPLGLLQDEETAKSLRHIVKNAEEITKKLYPIMDDARVFSNKIAHRPSSLIWDKTTSKGGIATGRYGFQSDSPNGGLSSSLFRMTPSGSRIRERSQYDPCANDERADASATYRYDCDELDVARNSDGRYATQFPSDYSRALPTPSARTERTRWSLNSFWDMLGFGKSRAREEERRFELARARYAQGFRGANYAEGYGAEYCEDGEFEDARFVGYEEPSVESQLYAVAQPSYAYPSDGDCLPASCNPLGCAPGPGAGGVRQPTYASLSGSQGVSRRAGDPEPVGAYGVTELTVEAGEFNLSEDETDDYNTDASDEFEEGEIEELPTSINRRTTNGAPIASPSNGGYGGDFEDDGLPMEFAPPTR